MIELKKFTPFLISCLPKKAKVFLTAPFKFGKLISLGKCKKFANGESSL